MTPPFPGAGGLIAPLDLARFALAYLAVAILPGYALATLARPRLPRLERLALTIPCAYSLVALCGLGTLAARLPFGVAPYAAVAFPVLLAALYRGRRRRATPEGVDDFSLTHPRPGAATPGSAGVPPVPARPSVGTYDERRRRGPAGGADLSPSDAGTGGMPALPGFMRGSDNPSSRPARDYWWVAPIAVAAAQVVICLVVYAGDTVPVGFDVVSHVAWTDAIARGRLFPLALLSSHAGDANGGFYPPVFHALAALTLGLAPMDTYRAVFYSVVAAAAFLPLALFCYVRAALDRPDAGLHAGRVAALAVVTALAFDAAPLATQQIGLYPFLASLLFVPALAVALRDGLVRGERGAAALAALLGAGLFYTHPTEFVSVALVGLALLGGRRALTPQRRPALKSAWQGPDLKRPTSDRGRADPSGSVACHGPSGPGSVRKQVARAAAYGIAIGGVWLVAAGPALVAVRHTMVRGARTEIHDRHDFAPPAQPRLGTVLNSYVQSIYGHNLSYLLLAATAAGIIWLLWRRRLRGLVAVLVIALAVFVDSTSYNLLRPLYVLSFPWALLQRLVPTHYWLVPPLAAIGLDRAAAFVARLSRRRSRPRPRGALFAALCVAPLALFGLVVPGMISAARAVAYDRALRTVAPADLGAAAWLRRHAPIGTTIVNDGDLDPQHVILYDAPIDAGRWLPLLGAPRPLFGHGGDGPGAAADRLYLLAHAADDPLPPRAASFVDRYYVRYVYYGAAVRPDATRHLSLPRLLADPRLTLEYASAPTCRGDSARRSIACGQPGAYVFIFKTAATVADRSVRGHA